MSRVRVKICCIASIEEARMAIAQGASAIGLVSAMPSGPGVIPEETIAAIASATPPPTETFLLTSLTEPRLIIEQQRRCRATALQICDRLEPGAEAELRRALPGVSFVQVVHVTGEEAVGEAVEAASRVDALLLDTGNRSGDVKELGGTGRTHDWALSRRIRQAVKVSVYLAGGLRAENVADAIRTVRPFAVDVCSGVRTDGKLDEEKLAAFFESVNRTS